MYVYDSADSNSRCVSRFCCLPCIYDMCLTSSDHHIWLSQAIPWQVWNQQKAYLSHSPAAGVCKQLPCRWRWTGHLHSCCHWLPYGCLECCQAHTNRHHKVCDQAPAIDQQPSHVKVLLLIWLTIESTRFDMDNYNNSHNNKYNNNKNKIIKIKTTTVIKITTITITTLIIIVVVKMLSSSWWARYLLDRSCLSRAARLVHPYKAY